ncbi:MAG: DUF1934 domain-containing protein [Lachnospiraceae bacterium]|nr:DUF1934 domain-containing protein [Lachnospiraceae bacterium]
MEDKYIISVVGTQLVDDEQDVLTMTTTASYSERNGKKLIKYKEYPDEDSEIPVTTLLKLEENKLTISKKMGVTSQLILECGKRHQCAYSTPIGVMTIGVYTESMEYEIDAQGGFIEVSYTLDFNADLESKNTINIKLTKKGDGINV